MPLPKAGHLRLPHPARNNQGKIGNIMYDKNDAEYTRYGIDITVACGDLFLTR